ncbi:MAG: SDR family NAD(P)-dependent oxidoreductase, partial [Hyphomonadaceae bacterium]
MSGAAPSLKTLAFAMPTQARRYDGRAAIVTGAAQGLGRVIARRLAVEGAEVLVADVQDGRVRRTAELLSAESGRRCVPVVGG